MVMVITSVTGIVMMMIMRTMKTVTVLKPAQAFSDQTFSCPQSLPSLHLSVLLSLCLFCLFVGLTGVACVQTYCPEILRRTLGSDPTTL